METTDTMTSSTAILESPFDTHENEELIDTSFTRPNDQGINLAERLTKNEINAKVGELPLTEAADLVIRKLKMLLANGVTEKEYRQRFKQIIAGVARALTNDEQLINRTQGQLFHKTGKQKEDLLTESRSIG